jgi:hypothetical protein
MVIVQVVNPKYKCSICNKEFDNFYLANLHEETGHPQKGYFSKKGFGE